MLLHLQDSYDAEVSLRHVDLCKVLLSARADVASLGRLAMAGDGSCMIGSWNCWGWWGMAGEVS